MTKAKYDLRKIRNDIYMRIRRRENVQECVKKYHTLTKDIIARFKSDLKVDEAALLREKVKIVRNAAKASKSKAKVRNLLTRTPDQSRVRRQDDRLDMAEQRSEDEDFLSTSDITIDDSKKLEHDATDQMAVVEHEVSDDKADNEIASNQHLQIRGRIMEKIYLDY